MGNKKTSLAARMKGYENIPRSYLTRRVPVIVRLDGKAFHTFTRGMRKPFDPVLTQAMQQTMKYLCENIQGCVFGYTQSDEITLVLTDYATIKTDAWFGYNVQKMTSIAASMATLAFNKAFRESYEDWTLDEGIRIPMDTLRRDPAFQPSEETLRLEKLYPSKFDMVVFDARVFSIPKDEVCNCLIWRQQDATRNSIEAVGQAHFSQSRLHGKTCNEIQEMLWSEKGINWNGIPTESKRGSCCVKRLLDTLMEDPRHPGQQVTVTRRRWVIDREPPIFTQDRAYIEALL